MLRNSTNIPDRLVAIALSFGMNDESMIGIEPPLCVVVKNKRRGKFDGQWGWYYAGDRRLVIIVPRKISYRHVTRLKYSRRTIAVSNRVEFLIAVMAHELRHCYQYQAWAEPRGMWRLSYGDRTAKMAREVDAELYQLRMLERWKKMMQAEAIMRMEGVS